MFSEVSGDQNRLDIAKWKVRWCGAIPLEGDSWCSPYPLYTIVMLLFQATFKLTREGCVLFFLTVKIL